MIKISRLADYGVTVLAALARSDEALLTAQELALRTNLPVPTVSKVLKLLSKSDILEAVRGANGGYKLAQNPARISVAAIIAAIEGPISLTACVEGSTDHCDFECYCPMKGRWDSVNVAIKAALSGVSLQDMTQTIRHPRAGGGPADMELPDARLRGHDSKEGVL